MAAATKIALWMLIAYLVYCVILFVVQRHIIFPRYAIGPPPYPAAALPPYEKLWLTTSFGRVEAWLIRPGSQSTAQGAPVVVFAHGNAERIDHCAAEMIPFSAWGCAILMVEYPGYGSSEGSPSQKRITEAMVSAHQWISHQKGLDASRIVLYGRSVGGGAVCALAAKKPSAALILVSTFSSIRTMAVKFLAPGFLVRDPFDNRSVVQAYQLPVLIIHGRHDEIVPYSHGLALHQAARHSQLITYECGHNDLPPDWDQFWFDVHAFLVDADIISAAASPRPPQ